MFSRTSTFILRQTIAKSRQCIPIRRNLTTVKPFHPTYRIALRLASLYVDGNALKFSVLLLDRVDLSLFLIQVVVEIKDVPQEFP